MATSGRQLTRPRPSREKTLRRPENLIIVPARLESGRVKHKALLKCDGKPLIVYTAEAALAAAKEINGTVVIVTDSFRICEALRPLTGIRLLRTEGECWCGTVRAGVALARTWQDHKHVRAVINWQMDEPLVETGMIKKLAGHFVDHPCDIATLVAPLTQQSHGDSNAVKAHVQGGECLDFRRNMNQLVNRLHIGVYAFRPSVLCAAIKWEPSQRSLNRRLEQLTWLDNGRNIDAVEVGHVPISIHCQSDWTLFCANILSRKLEAADDDTTDG